MKPYTEEHIRYLLDDELIDLLTLLNNEIDKRNIDIDNILNYD